MDPADGLITQGEPRLSAHVDGREGGRLDRHARRARPSRSTRSGTTRCTCSQDWTQRDGEAVATISSEIADARANVIQRALLVRRRRHLYDVVDGEDGRRLRVPAQSDPLVLRSLSGARRSALGGVVDVGRAAAADARRPAVARSRASAIQVASTTAICARAMPPITRARSGHG